MDIKTATFELEELNNDIYELDKTDYMLLLANRGLPLTIITRLEALWDITKTIGNTVVNIGRIIIAKIVEFIEAHPHALLSLALCAIVDAFLGQLPFLGSILKPLLNAILIYYGLKLDGNDVFEALFNLAKDFIALIVDIFKIVSCGVE